MNHIKMIVAKGQLKEICLNVVDIAKIRANRLRPIDGPGIIERDDFPCSLFGELIQPASSATAGFQNVLSTNVLRLPIGELIKSLFIEAWPMPIHRKPVVLKISAVIVIAVALRKNPRYTIEDGVLDAAGVAFQGARDDFLRCLFSAA